MFRFPMLLCVLICVTKISQDFVFLEIDSQDSIRSLEGRKNNALHGSEAVSVPPTVDNNIDIQLVAKKTNLFTAAKTWPRISGKSGHTTTANRTQEPRGGFTLVTPRKDVVDAAAGDSRPMGTSLEDDKLQGMEMNAKRRSKRGVVELYNMVNCATGCNPLIYKGYGCYCGFLGSGHPVDGIDRCCKMHDICYDVANCPMYLEYVVPYYWKCYKGKSLCAIDHLDLGGSGSCAQRLCECDRLLSECLRRYPCPKHRAKCVSSPWRFLQNTLMFF